MASDFEGTQGGSAEHGSGGNPLLIAAIFAAGAGVGVGVKALLDRRRQESSDDVSSATTNGGDTSDADLPTVLRRAALDVALAATTRAAERLDSGAGREHSEDEEAVEQKS